VIKKPIGKRPGKAPSGKAAVSLATLAEPALAKINLTLRVLGRRADGYHLLESLVCFAAMGDRVELRIGEPLELRVTGPAADAAGPLDDNLVLHAARALEQRVPKLKLGRFSLTKRLPVGAGLGGGSADAAAALRLLAQANGLPQDDARLYEAAREIGSDVPVCLSSVPRWISGTGHELSAPVTMPKLFVVLVNPGIPLATRDVYGALAARTVAAPIKTESAKAQVQSVPRSRKEFLAFVSGLANDLEPPAFRLAPIVEEVLVKIHDQPACVLARMSGSGSTCFGIFASRNAAKLAARTLAIRHPKWWVRDTEIGGT
jgi:4-diphosphocytidyl-2-C-methyl-D-erythritol kinase